MLSTVVTRSAKETILTQSEPKDGLNFSVREQERNDSPRDLSESAEESA